MKMENICGSFFWLIMGLINSFFALMGMALIAVGIVVLNYANDLNDFPDHGFYSVPALLMFIGFAVTVIFCFGCVGVFRSNYCMLVTFASMLSVILLMEIAGGIAAYVLRSQFSEALNVTMTESFKHDNGTSEIWQNIEKDLKCCGLNGSADYANLHIPIPQSCCVKANCSTIIPEEIYSQGCGKTIEQGLSGYASFMLRWSLGVAFCHLAWILGTCYFARNVRRSNYETV